MDLPDHMTFQHFFFNTYIGYFLQALPFALAAGAGYALLFLPFGILFPLSQKAPTCKRTVAAGLLSVAVIEVLQPVPGGRLTAMT